MACCGRSNEKNSTRDDIESTSGSSLEKSNSDQHQDDESSAKLMVSYFQCALSLILLLFSVAIAMALIWTRQTQLSESIHPGATALIFWVVLAWMAAMEGCQTSLVGLVPVSKAKYTESHPTASKITAFVHKESNLERFIVGRQFLVVLAVFVVEKAGAAIESARVLGLPDILNSIFVNSGIALMLITVMIGQLMAQVNATKSMLDTINNWFVLYFVTYASMAIEMSGLLHATYLVQIVYKKLSGKDDASDTTNRTVVQIISFWMRVAFSLCVLAAAFASVLAALFEGKTTMWKGIPSFISVILFFALMSFAGILEGMQIAVLAVSKLPEDALLKHPAAKKSCDLVLRGDNLKSFLIGRQILVTASMFVVAKISGMNVVPGQGRNILGVTDAVQGTLFNSNILAAILTTIVASLVWRVIASSSPVSFLSNPVVYVVLRCCLLVESIGLFSAASILSSIQSKLCRYKPDEDYFGEIKEEQSPERDLELQETQDCRESDTDSVHSA